MWLWTISWRKLKIGLVLGALVALMAVSMPDTRTDMPVLSYGLAGRTVVIDAGHGGYDPGAIGRETKTPEKKITLEISQRLAKLASQAGAMVVMTRTEDAGLSDEGFQGKLIERKRQDLARRVEKALRVKPDIYISIHGNADPSPRWHGAQTFYYYGSPGSKQLATCIQDEMVRILGNNNRKAKEAVFFIMERTTMPTVTVEVGFLSNPEEEKLLTDDLYQSKVAYSIFSGTVKYFATREETQ
ncbi:MAG: N-acetylmuramoyl-L-alanine amidase [Candidatus Saccharibacteria bacterium]